LTRVASIPITSRDASVTYSETIITARERSGAKAATGTPPSNWITGIRHASRAACTVWPPSRNPIGSMLNAFSRKPMFASTCSISEPRAEPKPQTTAAAAPPKSGPASEISAFRHGVSPARSIVT